MAGWMQGGVSDDDKLDLTETGKVLRRTGRMIAPYRRRAILAGFLLITWTATVLSGPLLVRWAIDEGIRADNVSALNRAVIGYLVAAAVGYVTYRASVINLALVGENLLRDLRNRVFRRILDQSTAFHDRTKAGELVSRMTSDVDSLAELVQYGLIMFVSAGLVLSLSLMLLISLSWKLSLVIMVVLPIIVPASIKFKRDSNKAYLDVRDSIASTLSSMQEGFSGVRVVQAFAREDDVSSRFSSTNARLYRSHMRSVRIASWYLPLVDFSGVFTTAVALGVGGWMVRSGELTLGTVAAFVLLLSNLFEPVQHLSQLFNMVQSSTASLAKLYGLIDAVEDLPEAENPQPVPPGGAIDVQGVSFAYGEAGERGPLVLDDVSIHVEPGERLALVGPTGAGKSTLAKLMGRIYDPTAGTITFNGTDLRDLAIQQLRHQIVVVPQEGFLFSGSIAENIRVARANATDAEIEAALESINARERIEDLPQGLQTSVGERGGRLSAGERQLVSLARAALVDPQVLILDEATSSLDPGTEALVEAAMEALTANRTVIVIAHRLTTSERADRVGVVLDGKLAELGTHHELVALGGHYHEMYETWQRGLSADGGLTTS